MDHRDFIKLSRRLQMSADMVTPGNIVADVGCDHAHTVIYLVKTGIAPKAVAMDVGEGPLSHADANIRLYGLNGLIETRLSDGLMELKPGEVDTVIIAGMGGTLTRNILENSPEVVGTVKELILQPQSDPDLVRRFLREHGFEIVLEDACFEDGKYYNSMKAVHSDDEGVSGPETDKTGLSEEETEKKELRECMTLEQDMYDRFGKYLLEHKNPVLHDMLMVLKEKNELILTGIKASGGEGSKEKQDFFEKERKMILKALEIMDEA